MPKVKIIFICAILFISFIAKAATPEIIFIRTNADSVGLYDKFEIGLNLKAAFVNPFNPDEIDITATFIAPSGKQWNINGFYNYAFGSVWKVRFAPNELGTWKYVVQVTDKNGKTTSEQKMFTAITSSYNGPLSIAANKRYLEYHNGTPFYGVGFWYNDGYTGFNSGQVKPEELDNLKKLGVNFISTFITPLETLGSGLGRYDQNISGRIDDLLKLLEERDMQLSLNIWFHAFLSETVWGGGNVRWYTNPYQQITAAKDFYRSKEAWDYQQKLYRYFIARWGYSRSLATWFIIDEVNGTDGWVSGDSTMAFNWGKNVHNYFKKNDPYQHLTTGTRSGGNKEFWHEAYQTFDMAAREIYEAQGFAMNRSGTMDSATAHPLAQSYSTYAGEVSKLWNGYEKPAIIGESGWDHTFYEPGMPGYLALYHNALWASLGSGAAMTPFWWAFSNRLNDNMVTAQITSVRKFTDQIPFSKLTNLTKAGISVSSGDGYAIKSNEMIFGWLANPQTDVAGKTVQINNVNAGNYKLRLYHTWRGQYLDTTEVNSSNGSISFSIPVLHMGSNANYIGQDIAFVIEPVPMPPVDDKTMLPRKKQRK
ncbi:MAG: hypothetical protein JWQ09_2599 [Segetibacter sp.]|nr:hypothetical protein [Segetibacter sp.]